MRRKSQSPGNEATTRETVVVEGNLQVSLGYAIRRAQIVAYQEFAAVMGETGIRPVQYAILVLIFERPGIIQSGIGAALNIEKGNLTGLLLELQKLGYTKRESVPTDRRAYAVQLTALGKTRTRAIMKQHTLYEERLASKLEEGEKKLLLSLLSKLGSESTGNPG